MGSATLRDRVKEKVAARTEPSKSTPPPTTSKAKPPKFEAYYDSAKKTFWIANSRGELMDVTEGSLKRWLRAKGCSNVAFLPNGLNQVDGALLEIQHERDVHFAGPLAGYPVGENASAGSRILVTRGPAVLKPGPGECPTLQKYFRELFADQVPYVFGWLKAGLASLRAGPPWRPGQMLAVAGPAGAGKSLFQSLITEIFGGRVAKPYRYLIGETAFNSELFGAEHLAIEDEAASTDLRTRRHFGSQIKNLIVNEVQSFHAKGRQALGLTPFWRVSVTLNDEAENLMVLPPLDDSLRDKILLLKAGMPNFPFDADGLAERKAFRERLTKELPPFLAFLSQWRIPEKLKDKRYGVKAFQHPDLIRELDSLAPEYRLLAMIENSSIWNTVMPCWTGTALALETELRKEDKTGEGNRVFTFSSACGVYLGRLLQKFPDRFTQERGAGNTTVWTIKRKD